MCVSAGCRERSRAGLSEVAGVGGHELGGRDVAERFVEAVGQRVVEGVADRSDARQDAVVIERLTDGEAGVLRSGVRVVNQLDVGASTAGRECHP